MLNRYIFIFLLFIGFQLSPAQNDSYFEVSKNLDIFSTLYKQIDLNYVDDIDPGKLMKTGVDAMLNTLDPYTVYISEGDIEDYRFMTTGEYGGIGALFHLQDSFPVISAPHEGFAADKAGLRAGDRIVAINDQKTKGKSIESISNILHGQPGTAVTLTIDRPYTAAPFTVEVVREKVKPENIPYSGMVSENIAYIKLNGFTQNAGNEVQSAFNALRKDNDVKGLIIDLRGNGGGLLLEAVKICNLFVDKGQLIVSTKGKLKASNNSYKTMEAPLDKDIPLAILINSRSASASEIVAGALQDVDRAVIVGSRSFGKGLVQNVFPLSYNAQVKVTTAKYYIPSGRCIQAIDYSHRDEDGAITKIPDSITSVFYTNAGRPVRDGGGIVPDIDTRMDDSGILTRALNRNYLIFDFATKYRKEHETLARPVDFMIDDAIFEDFSTFLHTTDFSYDTRTEEKLKEVEDMAKEEDYIDALGPAIDDIRQKMAQRKERDLQIYRDDISRALRLEIVSRYHYEKGRVISALSDDPDVLRAVEVLNDTLTYHKILSTAKADE